MAKIIAAVPLGKPKITTEFLKIPTVGKDAGKLPQTAHDVNYMGPSEAPFKCGHCEYFEAPSSCEKVAGKIDANGCCNLYSKKSPTPSFKEAALAALTKKT